MKLKNTRPGCFCAKDCLDCGEKYIHGGILSLLLVVVGCSGLHCAVLGCTGYIYQAVVWSGFDHWDSVNSYFFVYSAIFGMVTNEQPGDPSASLL